VIELTVCYYFNELQPVLTFNNDFFIPLLDSGNYTINVPIYTSDSFETCNNYSTLGTYVFQHNFLETKAFSKNNLKIYPNPTNGIINFIGLDAKINRVVVYDIVGKMIKNQNFISENTLDLNSFQDGIYIVKIETDLGVLNKKIVLKR
jgi:hypothetical protein